MKWKRAGQAGEWRSRARMGGAGRGGAWVEQVRFVVRASTVCSVVGLSSNQPSSWGFISADAVGHGLGCSSLNIYVTSRVLSNEHSQMLHDCQLQDSTGCVLSFCCLPLSFRCHKSPTGHRASHPTSTSSAGSHGESDGMDCVMWNDLVYNSNGWLLSQALQNPAACLILKFVLGNISYGLPLGRSWFLGWMGRLLLMRAMHIIWLYLCFILDAWLSS